MSKLKFAQTNKDTNRNAFIVWTNNGERHFRCVVPCEDFADRFGSDSGETFQAHLSEVKKRAEELYESKGLNAEGELLVTFFEA